MACLLLFIWPDLYGIFEGMMDMRASTRVVSVFFVVLCVIHSRYESECQKKICKTKKNEIITIKIQSRFLTCCCGCVLSLQTAKPKKKENNTRRVWRLSIHLAGIKSRHQRMENGKKRVTYTADYF